MRILFLAGTLLLAAACAKPEQPKAKPLSVAAQRQHDSILGASKIPGAGGVGAALRVSDSAAARRAREDTIGDH